MKYIAILDSENEFTEKVIEALKDTAFLGDNPRYAFVIDNIQERKVGKWVNKTHKSGCGILFVASECTCCRKKTLFNCDEFLYDYCPNCGAEMVGAENE